jgi:hypothetical protein
MTTLVEWGNFYVIVGSSAGALIGLQFVVMTLVANKRIETSETAGGALATPTVVHFGAVLLLSALVSAPWHGFDAASVLWGLVGLGGVIYVAVVARRLRAQTVYKPVFEDWLCRVLLPLAAYVTLAVSAFAVLSRAREALFGVGASALLLLFVGVHNVWDSVVFLVMKKE